KNSEDLHYLIDAGIDYLQGNYIGMPSAKAVPISEDIVRKIKALNNKHDQ
ncbi:MAG: EAL domain-containing protein, partial [Crenarchaeota archaeon]|nr:EAL domain-containing protein [Thermoproteota archaeon]